MVILGTIQSARLNSYVGKAGKVDEIEVVFMDSSKFYRCASMFQVRIPLADKAKVFGPKKLSQLADEKCTVTVPQLAAFNIFMQVRGGTLHMGHLSTEQLAKLQDDAEV